MLPTIPSELNFSTWAMVCKSLKKKKKIYILNPLNVEDEKTEWPTHRLLEFKGTLGIILGPELGFILRILGRTQKLFSDHFHDLLNQTPWGWVSGMSSLKALKKKKKNFIEARLVSANCWFSAPLAIDNRTQISEQRTQTDIKRQSK